MKKVELSNEELKLMQKLQLEMLLEVDRICRKHNIRYNLSGGSLLGAIRHKGFIPWDDDIDVRMLRDDYEKFREICREELNDERYYFQNNVDEYEYRWGFSRLLLNNTKYVRCEQEHLSCRTGIFIDIFPSDGVADNPVVFYYQGILALFLRKALWAPVGCVICTNPLKRGWFALLNKIPKRFLLKIQSHLVNTGKRFKSKRVVCHGLPRSDVRRWGFSRATLTNTGIMREWLEELMEVSFEGHMVFIPKEYDKWLRYVYGSCYMELPPVEKRTIHHYVSEFQLCDMKKESR